MKCGEYIAVYDISDDNERSQVQKVLEGYGFAIQKSVFECVLNKWLKKELINKLEKLKLKTGFIKIYRCDKTIKSDIIGEYDGKENPDGGNAYVV
jgi:CRISPR-associated protein Cas2